MCLKTLSPACLVLVVAEKLELRQREILSGVQQSNKLANEETPDWAQQLLSEVANLKDSFNRRFDELVNSMKDLKKETRAILNRVSKAEKRIGDLEDEDATADKALKDLTKEVNFLKTKFTNLESHSRRNNLVFVGLEEGLETGNPDKMVGDILRYILDLTDSDPIREVERQHRSLRPHPAPTEPPPPYLVRILRWSDRQKILWVREVRKGTKGLKGLK